MIIFLSALILSNAESAGNDCYWYRRYAEIQFNDSGEVINESISYVYPEEGWFEIRFDYKQDFENSSVVCPFSIYMSELVDNTRAAERLVGYFARGLDKIEIESDVINIYILNEGFRNHVVVQYDGTIIIYRIENGKYISAQLFESDDVTRSLYSIRYSVLRQKLTKL